VAFSKEDEEFRSDHLLVRPWGFTGSTPHADIRTNYRVAPAGSFHYEAEGA
jgi:hypothetical protein